MVKSTLRFRDNDEGIEVENYNEDEAAQLSKVVTNMDDNVYAWKLSNDLSAEQAGALLSRYSRTALTGRRLYLKEFLPNKERGREFFEAWLVDYGDDSIQEMAGGIPMSCEYVSNVLAKEIEDSRMGSYIEKSTRYVYFDKKLSNGEYMFYKDPNIMESRYGDAYVELMRSLFDSYVNNTDKMAAYIKEKNPYEAQKFNISNTLVTPQEMNKEIEDRLGISEQDLQKSYENAIKANALDFMRDYLPMSILTHVGISMNARSYENTINRLLSSPLYEANSIARKMHAELTKVVPSLVKRVNDKHGASLREFITKSRENTTSVSSRVAGSSQPKDDRELVRLVEFTGQNTKDPDKEASVRLAAFALYRFGRGYSLAQAIEIASSMTPDERDQIISSYVGTRTNRRHKPGRAFENINYTFDFCCRIGIYRDLHRHRIGTQERQPFTVKHGYNMRQEYKDIGIDDDYKAKMDAVTDLYNKIAETMPYQAQYVVTFGYNVRWYYTFNARQLFHFAELRTGSGGHPDYRDLTQKVYMEVKRVHPSVAKYMNFIDLNKKQLGRLESEIRIVQKKKKLEGKS